MGFTQYPGTAANIQHNFSRVRGFVQSSEYTGSAANIQHNFTLDQMRVVHYGVPVRVPCR